VTARRLLYAVVTVHRSHPRDLDLPVPGPLRLPREKEIMGMIEEGTILGIGVGHHLHQRGTVEREMNRPTGEGRTRENEAMIEGGRDLLFRSLSTVDRFNLENGYDWVRLVIMHVLTVRLLFGLSGQSNVLSHTKSPWTSIGMCK